MNTSMINNSTDGPVPTVVVSKVEDQEDDKNGDRGHIYLPDNIRGIKGENINNYNNINNNNNSNNNNNNNNNENLLKIDVKGEYDTDKSIPQELSKYIRSKETIQKVLNKMEDIDFFLKTAPINWQTDQVLRRFYLNAYLGFVSCVFWNNIFYITGTDIVKACVYQMEQFGRKISQRKKFEEGIFSDLRNLKCGIDATLEQPKSKLLSFLFKNYCLKTQKKQKIFFWFSVPHLKLFADALERDLKREALHQVPSTIPVAEPALSFKVDLESDLSLTDQLLNYLNKKRDKNHNGIYKNSTKEHKSNESKSVSESESAAELPKQVYTGRKRNVPFKLSSLKKSQDEVRKKQNKLTELSSTSHDSDTIISQTLVLNAAPELNHEILLYKDFEPLIDNNVSNQTKNEQDFPLDYFPISNEEDEENNTNNNGFKEQPINVDYIGQNAINDNQQSIKNRVFPTHLSPVLTAPYPTDYYDTNKNMINTVPLENVPVSISSISKAFNLPLSTSSKDFNIIRKPSDKADGDNYVDSKLELQKEQNNKDNVNDRNKDSNILQSEYDRGNPSGYHQVEVDVVPYDQVKLNNQVNMERSDMFDVMNKRLSSQQNNNDINETESIGLNPVKAEDLFTNNFEPLQDFAGYEDLTTWNNHSQFQYLQQQVPPQTQQLTIPTYQFNYNNIPMTSPMAKFTPVVASPWTTQFPSHQMVNVPPVTSTSPGATSATTSFFNQIYSIPNTQLYRPLVQNTNPISSTRNKYFPNPVKLNNNNSNNNNRITKNSNLYQRQIQNQFHNIGRSDGSLSRIEISTSSNSNSLLSNSKESKDNNDELQEDDANFSFRRTMQL